MNEIKTIFFYQSMPIIFTIIEILLLKLPKSLRYKYLNCLDLLFFLNKKRNCSGFFFFGQGHHEKFTETLNEPLTQI